MGVLAEFYFGFPLCKDRFQVGSDINQLGGVIEAVGVEEKSFSGNLFGLGVGAVFEGD